MLLLVQGSDPDAGEQPEGEEGSQEPPDASCLAAREAALALRERELERRLLRVQRLESLGALAGGLVHDLNNTLSAILMSVTLLEQDEPEPERRQQLESIEGCARRGGEMVRQVLSFARGGEGRKLPVRVQELVREVQRVVEATFLKSVELRLLLQVGLCPVRGDPTQLHQVLLNLCLNARDAMPSGGTLTVSAERISLLAGDVLDPCLPGPYVLLRVRDTGTGMSEAVCQRIFEPFFTTKEPGKGTGLGLSTSLAIVRAHGGFMRVESAPAEGTVVSVFLPAFEAEARRPAPADASLPHGRGQLLLVVDDDRSIREMMTRTLAAYGYRIVAAESGSQACEVHKRSSERFAAVLLDQVMPELDGAGTAAALREKEPRLRILGTSGLHCPTLPDWSDDFLRKPFSVPELLQAIDRLLRRAA
jgi:signal transduction histidine kinase